MCVSSKVSVPLKFKAAFREDAAPRLQRLTRSCDVSAWQNFFFVCVALWTPCLKFPRHDMKFLPWEVTELCYFKSLFWLAAMHRTVLRIVFLFAVRQGPKSNSMFIRSSFCKKKPVSGSKLNSSRGSELFLTGHGQHQSWCHYLVRAAVQTLRPSLQVP